MPLARLLEEEGSLFGPTPPPLAMKRKLILTSSRAVPSDPNMVQLRQVRTGVLIVEHVQMATHASSASSHGCRQHPLLNAAPYPRIAKDPITRQKNATSFVEAIECAPRFTCLITHRL